MSTTIKTILYYIHDPMCSWCWGYRPVWNTLKLNLPESIQVEYVVGGLAPDSDTPMPLDQQKMIEAHWHTIEKKLGTEFNFDFWRNNTPRRSTYNACRAVIAANNQGYQLQMIEAIQKGYYLRALNPSDSEILIELARGISTQEITKKTASEGDKPPVLAFDLPRFTRDFKSEETQQVLTHQIQLARALTNQGFPSLVLECDGAHYQIPINYEDYHATLTTINNVLAQ
ncbi:DsbA family protein [Colwellia sp. 20A7]|uniref:DsbA family protein n=1 Tax=Colwellia sp. 20A7 TaxID=2689569 RepID=UPI001359DFF9|nr:DsbA family protein [Colwellia sp. 20A7]